MRPPRRLFSEESLIAGKDAPARAGGGANPRSPGPKQAESGKPTSLKYQGDFLMHGVVLHRRHPDTAASSSMNPPTTPRPLAQKAGSAASRPKGASSSLCRLVPPARSMSRYFAAKPCEAP